MPCWMKQARMNVTGRNINNFRYANDTTPMGKNVEELKSLLKRVKEESEKAGLKLNIQKTKFMASSASLLSAIRVVSSTYLRLLIFLLAILIPSYASSSTKFLMMYPA